MTMLMIIILQNDPTTEKNTLMDSLILHYRREHLKKQKLMLKLNVNVRDQIHQYPHDKTYMSNLQVMKKWMKMKKSDLPPSNRNAPTKMILEKEYFIFINVNYMLTRILNKNIGDMEVTVKGDVRQLCVALLSYRYHIRQRVLDWL